MIPVGLVKGYFIDIAGTRKAIDNVMVRKVKNSTGTRKARTRLWIVRL